MGLNSCKSPEHRSLTAASPPCRTAPVNHCPGHRTWSCLECAFLPGGARAGRVPLSGQHPQAPHGPASRVISLFHEVQTLVVWRGLRWAELTDNPVTRRGARQLVMSRLGIVLGSGEAGCFSSCQALRGAYSFKSGGMKSRRYNVGSACTPSGASRSLQT